MKYQPDYRIRITPELAARLDALIKAGDIDLSRDECARRLLRQALDHVEKRPAA